MKIRYRVFCIISLFMIIISAIFLIARYNNYKKMMLNSVDDKLFKAAMVAHAGIQQSYFDNSIAKISILKERVQNISKRYNQLNKELGTDYLWSILENDGEIIFSSSGGSNKNGEYFKLLTYSVAYGKAFSTMTPQYQDITASETRLRSIFIPFIDNSGRRLIVGACLRWVEGGRWLRHEILFIFSVLTAIITLSFVISILVTGQFGKPIRALSDAIAKMVDRADPYTILGNGLYEYSFLIDNVNRIVDEYRTKTDMLMAGKAHLDMERLQLFSIFQGIDEEIYIVDPITLEILFINKPIGSNQPEDLVGKSCYREIYGFDNQCVFCTNEILLQKKPEPHRWDYHDPKRQRYFAMIDRLIIWPDGRDVVFHFAIDITERKLSEEKIRNLFERSQHQAKELAARQKDLRLVNEGLEIQTEALIQSEADLKARQEELAHTNKVLSEQSSLLEEQKRHLNDKNVALEKTKKEVEQKAVELEITSRYKSDFLANMSHELRTPLNSILLLSRYLAEDSKDNLSNKQKECAETVYSSGNELLALINEVLDLARVESGHMTLEPVDTNIRDLFDDLEKKFRPVADDKGLGFELYVDNALPENIRTDSLRLGQILRNLLSNAFKFTDKGSVHFEASYQSSGLPVVFTVKDTGEGIENDKQEIVFHAFKQADGSTSRKHGGTGLGLSISREYAIALQGKLTLVSTIGLGSIFSLEIPYDITNKEIQIPLVQRKTSIVNEKSESPDVQIGKKKEVDKFEIVFDDRDVFHSGGKAILIIDWNAENAGRLRDIIRTEGYSVLVADTGEGGLFLTEAYSPEGIILNMELPGMAGKTVLFRLKDSLLTRHIPVCVIPAEGRLLEPMRMGAIRLINKNAGVDEIKESIDHIKRLYSGIKNKILIVEDSLPSQQVISKVIGAIDVDTVVVSTGKEAITKLNQETFDCVILDLGLPDVSGTDFLVELRKVYSNYVPVIVFTGLELSPGELSILDNYANSIVIKGDKSKEKILDYISIFLHLPIDEFEQHEQKMITKMYDRETILDGKKVLIADDDMRNVFSLLSVLEDKGIEILVAKTGKEALDILIENPETDIVLMDIMMPEMDGYDAIKEIRKMDGVLRTVPVIALTARAMKGDRARCIQVGANDYISKPVEVDKLLSMLRVWLY